MELFNFIRFKEDKVQPSLNNNMKNCCLNIISISRSQKQNNTVVNSPKEVLEDMFTFKIKLENDDSHISNAIVIPSEPKLLGKGIGKPKHIVQPSPKINFIIESKGPKKDIKKELPKKLIKKPTVITPKLKQTTMNSQQLGLTGKSILVLPKSKK